MGWTVIKSLHPFSGVFRRVSVPAWGFALGVPLRALHKLQKVKWEAWWGSLSLHGLGARVCEGTACCAGWLLGTAAMEKGLSCLYGGPSGVQIWVTLLQLGLKRGEKNKGIMFFFFFPLPGRECMCWEKWSFKNVETWSKKPGDIRNTWNIH